MLKVLFCLLLIFCPALAVAKAKQSSLPQKTVSRGPITVKKAKAKPKKKAPAKAKKKASVYLPLPAVSASETEVDFVREECPRLGGQSMVRLDAFTVVDCLTTDEAVEFAQASQWSEAVGRALHNGRVAKRVPAIVFIVDRAEEQGLVDQASALVRHYRLKVRIYKLMTEELEAKLGNSDSIDQLERREKSYQD